MDNGNATLASGARHRISLANGNGVVEMFEDFFHPRVRSNAGWLAHSYALPRATDFHLGAPHLQHFAHFSGGKGRNSFIFSIAYSGDNLQDIPTSKTELSHVHHSLFPHDYPELEYDTETIIPHIIPKSRWFYFGCYQQAGHYVFRPGMRSAYGTIGEKLAYFDGSLPPRDSTAGYIATVSRLGGWGLTALAFWDYTVDKRGGCNSVFFAPSLTISVDDLIAGAKEQFPQVWARLPEITIHEGSKAA